MKFKKYVVANMNEAISLIRAELGNEAIIVSHRKIRRPGFTGLFIPKMLEVTAAVEEKAKGSKVNKASEEKDGFEKDLEAIKSLFNKHNKEAEHGKHDEVAVASLEENTYNELMKEMKEVKKIMSSLKVYGDRKEESEVAKYLSEKDFMEEYIEELEELALEQDEFSLKLSKIKEQLEEEICFSNSEDASVMVFVGPTGVGKTTTIAKLAGKLALKDKKKVGLVTIDTYRIGAVDQLRTYAEIMNLPFKVVFTVKEMEEALESLKECDIILVDTTGRSSKNTMQLSELRLFIEKVKKPAINLVISSTTKNKDLKSIIDGYSELKYNNIIITKVDETNTYGFIYNIAKLSQKPISYITNGQSVPDNIEVASKQKIISLILQED